MKKSFSPWHPTWTLALCSLLLGLPCPADTIHLKNGKTLDGLIKEENSHQVVLDIGLGAITIRRSQIDAIARSDQKESQQLQSDWKTHYATHDKFAPENQRDLAAQFRELELSRSAAIKAQGNIQSLLSQQKAGQQNLLGVKNRLLQVNRELSKAKPQDNLKRYNELVAMNNKLNAETVVSYNQLQQQEQTLKKSTALLNTYMKRFDAFQQNLLSRLDSITSPTHPDLSFLEGLHVRTEDMQKEFQQFAVPHDRQNNHIVVKAKINDLGTASLMVDTGASVVTLSEVAARRLGVPLTGKYTATMNLADGTQVKAEPVILDSLQVGDARLEQVAAAVMPESSTSSRDGLLGLSFLSAFDMQYNAASGDLVLQAFRPH